MEVRNISSQSQSSQAAGGRIVNNGSTAGNVPVTRAVSASMLANMEKGSIFSGDIIDVRNSFIKILLDGNQTITAKTSDNSNLNIGDYIKFVVKENTGDQIFIKTLNINNSHTNPLVLALQSGNIPVTEENMNMVSEMMRNEMPIDKNSVNEMYKNISMFENSNPKTIVNLVRHEIPLNETNISQFEKYINYEHRLNFELLSIADEIPNTLLNISNGNEQSAKNIFNDIINNLPDVTEADIYNNDMIEENIINEKSVIDKEDVYELNSNYADDLSDKIFEGIDINHNSVDEIIKYIIENNNDNNSDNDNINNTNNTSDKEFDLNSLINSKEFYIPNKEFLQKLTNVLNDNQFSTLMKNEKVLKYLKAGILKKYLIDINKLGNNGKDIKENIKASYERLENEIKQLEDTFKNYPKEASDLFEKTNSIKQNLSFMNEINQMASYVQLPLRFSNGTTHGELYVYNKAHGKLADKDVLTAFMHLDMDNLGATDIDIRLEESKLSTNFSMSDDLSAKIVEEHLSELKDRLIQAGYNVSINVKTEELSNENPFEKVLELDRPKMSIKRFSFDVRA